MTATKTKFVFTPLWGLEKAEEALSRGENPYGKDRPKRDEFCTYWLYEGHALQWVWWQLKLGLPYDPKQS